MLVLNLPFKALMFLTLMRPSLVLFLVLWLKLVKDFLKVRCRLALLPFLISCLIWLDLVASLPLIKERRSEERFSRNAETDLVCRLLLEKKDDEMPPWGAETGTGRNTHPEVPVGARLNLRPQDVHEHTQAHE